jgi:hypothetical protein
MSFRSTTSTLKIGDVDLDCLITRLHNYNSLKIMKYTFNHLIVLPIRSTAVNSERTKKNEG